MGDLMRRVSWCVPRTVGTLAALLIFLSCAVHSVEDGSLEKQGLEAKAAAMLAEEEKSEEMIHRESMRIRQPQPERAVDDRDPTPPWEAEAKAKKVAQDMKNEETRVAARITKAQRKHAPNAHVEQYADLGESEEVT